MHDLGQHMTTSDLWHCILILQRSSEVHWPWLTPCLPIVANMAVLGLIEVLRPNTRLIFHIQMFIVPFYTIRCQTAPLNQLALEWFLEMIVTLFPSETLCATNIPSISYNNMLFLPGIERRAAGENCRPLRFIVFEIYACKVKNLSFLPKFDLWPIIIVSNINLG